MANDINMTSGLVGWWAFDEGVGQVAYDSSSYSQPGNWTGGVGTNGYYSLGKVGPWAGRFDGITTYLPLSNSATGPLDSALTKNFTISMWVQTPTGARQTLFSTNYAAGVNSLTLGISTQAGSGGLEGLLSGRLRRLVGGRGDSRWEVDSHSLC